MQYSAGKFVNFRPRRRIPSFHARYSTLEFQDAANPDEGDVWPVSFALLKWSPAVEEKVAGLVEAAIS